MRAIVVLVFLAAAALACTVGFDPVTPDGSGSNAPPGDDAVVTQIIDGDTIDVRIGEVGYRVRYIGVNTPERDEVCYREATNANANLVRGQTVRLVRDQSNTDSFGRLLRYVYVGDRFVNAELVREGWAEAVEYAPDRAQTAYFRQLEIEARNANRGCHPTGIFNDGNDRR
jgi:endonuclease YncB( thermonuclease family)